MSVARVYQTPRSLLLGRSLPGPGEPLWLDDDVEWAIAYESYRGSLCQRCGTRHEDWLDENGRPVEAFKALPTRCPGEQAIAISDKEIPESERAEGAYSVLLPAEEWDYREEIKDAAARLGMKRPRLRGL